MGPGSAERPDVELGATARRPVGAAGPSSGRTVAVVLGVLGITGVAVVGLLIGAVTFLGQSSETRFERVDVPATTDGPGTDPWSDEPPADGYGPGLTASEAVLLQLEFSLTDEGWAMTDRMVAPADDVMPSACAPDGWLTGAADVAIGGFSPPGDGRPDALTITVVTYETQADVDAELERARSTAHAECEIEQRRATGRPDAGQVTPLPEASDAPGVAFALGEADGAEGIESTQTVVVGRMRAQIDVCSCAGFDDPSRQVVAADVAALLAQEQDLPVPG